MKISHQSTFQNKFKLFLCCLTLIFTSCYTVNDRTYLNIVFNDSKLSAVYLNNYIDSVRSKGLSIPDSIKEIFLNGRAMYDNERLVQFKNKPQEWHLISFDATPCWIESIYNPSVADYVIYDKRFISEAEQNRIKRRFETEVLKEAEKYGKNHHLPDSIIYNKFK